jgi:catecholate siderophore receptor
MNAALRPSLSLQPTIGLASLGLASLFGIQDAEAQTASGDQAPIRLPELTVGGAPISGPGSYRRDDAPLPRMPTSVAETPQSITVVPREVMQEQAASSVRDALRNVTGISLAAGEGGFSGDNLTLRGFSARGDFFIDGLRDLGQYTRDSFFLESVDVLKGPSSVAFGRGSTGGVINQTTRLPLSETQGEVWLSAYTPSGVRSTADVNVRAGNVAARMNAMASRIDASQRDEVYNQRWGIFPSITWGMDGPTQLTLSWLHQEEENVPDYGVPFQNGRPLKVGHDTFYGLASDREKTTTDVATARVSHRVSDGVRLTNTFRWANYGREISATAPRLNADPTRVTRQPQVRDGLDTFLVNQTEASLDFTTGPVRHSALVGFEIGRESSEVTRYQQRNRPTADLENPNPLDPANLTTTVNSDIKTVANTWAVYAVDRMQLGEMFELILGGRWDSFDAESDNRTSGETFSRLDEAFSWRGALVFKPTEGVRTYVAYGTSFNPSAEALTLAANNAALPPEESESYEIGASAEIAEGLRISGAVFRIEKKNARTADPAAGNVQTLDGEVRVDGFEIQAVGRITPDWNMMVGYTRLDSEIRESSNAAERGKEFANVAPNSFSLWTTYNLPYGFQLGGGAQYVDRRFANTTNTNLAPDYLRWDAALAWQAEEGPLKGLRVQLNALNLGDAKAYDTVYPGHVVPSVGRTFVLSTAMRF